MNILKTIKERRSTVAFQRTEIDTAILMEIFTYGSYAPTHYMTEAWRIKLFQKEGKQHLVTAIMNSYKRIGMLPAKDSLKAKKTWDAIANFLMKIPHHALIYYEKPQDPIRNEEEYSSIAAFIQNCQLAAWEHEIGVLWTIAPYMYDEKFIEEIGLNPNKHKIAAVLQIGYPEKVTKFKPRIPAADFVEIIE